MEYFFLIGKASDVVREPKNKGRVGQGGIVAALIVGEW